MILGDSIVKIVQTSFDLDLTLCCGQVFNWKKKEGWWYGIIEDNFNRINDFPIAEDYIFEKYIK